MLNIILADASPVFHVGPVPTYPQVIVTEAGVFLLLAIIAIATWKPSRERKAGDPSTS